MKKFKKLLLIFVVLAIVGFSTLIGIDLYVRLVTERYFVEVDDTSEFESDYILVLGAGIYPDGTPSPMLKERLDRAIELYKEKPTVKIIASGDHMKANHDEVNAMKNYMTAEGVPSDDIFMDHAGISTYDSLYRAKHIFGADKLIVVTQKYHLYRALYIGRELDIEVRGVDAQKKVYNGQFYRDTREFLARIKDFAKSIIKPQSTYLGEKISISDGGNSTNDKKYVLLKSEDEDYEKYITSVELVDKFMYIIENASFDKRVCKEEAVYTVQAFDKNQYELEIDGTRVHMKKDDKEAILSELDSKYILSVLDEK